MSTELQSSTQRRKRKIKKDVKVDGALTSKRRRTGAIGGVVDDENVNAGSALYNTHPDALDKPASHASLSPKKGSSMDITPSKIPGEAEIGDVHKKAKQRRSTAWSISEPVGGRFIIRDPLFGRNDEYIILAKKHAINVFWTINSRLVQTLTFKHPEVISDYKLSVSDTSLLYIVTKLGQIKLCNWLDGNVTVVWKTKSKLHRLAVGKTEEGDLLYTLEHQGNWNVVVRSVLRGDSKLSSKILLQDPQPLHYLQIAGNGQVLAAAASDFIYVGRTRQLAGLATEDMSYVWRKISVNEPLTCIDLYSISTTQDGDVALAFGCVRGQIYVVNDVLEKLDARSPKSLRETSTDILTPRLLHWHRDAVGALKWSKDGNYLISGGRETVLLIWQLETGKRQDLPHLPSAIDSITVSTSGSAYALRLADNSVIILSTAELAPKTYIAGIQARALLSNEGSKTRQIRTSNTRTPPEGRTCRKTICIAMHPKRKSELLLTAPTSQPWTLALNSTTSSPYLQTYDTLKDLHVSRQALCRNHATSFSVGPEATTLTEPNVTHMKISRDGSWLATTEEWMQPVEDFEFQADGGLAVLAARKLRREVYLKFWLWRDDKKLWTLETRVNKPHRSSEKHVRSRVYDLVADPARSCFATIGEDRLVKLWKSTARIRDGIVVRGSKGEEMVTWSCQHAVELHKCLASLDADDDDMDTGLDEGLAAASPFVTSHPANALLAYADDGSILAACQEFEPNIGPGKVYLINPQSGQLLMVLPDLYSKNLVGLACIDRYLVTVSDELFVWDLVNGTLVYGFSLSQSDLSHDNPSSGMTGLCFAAEDLDVTPTEAEMSCHRSRTFAIVRPTVKRKSSSRTGGSQRDQSKKLSSSLMIFDPQKPNPIYSEELPYVVTALAPIPADGGYVAVDAEAGVRTIRFRRNLPAITSEEKIIASLPQDLPVQSMLVPYRSAIPRGPTDAIRMQADDSLPEDLLSVGPDVDLPVIRPEHLGRLFDSDTAHSHPRVDELYDSVLKLFTAGPETVK